ncbi:MAG TPA: hypothetical protein VII06_36350 [Chloroflexota bacterium]|jgi:hypothetical protein
MSTCPDVGRWRAWLDGAVPAPAPDLPGHLTACPGCRAVVDDLRTTAAVTATALDTLAPTTPAPPAAGTLARQRLAWAQRRATPAASAPAHRATSAISLSLEQPNGATLTPTSLSTQHSVLSTRLRRWRAAAAGVAAALALVLLVGTPQGRTATAQFLAQFRSQRFAVVTIEPGRDRAPLAYLDHLGSVQGSFRARHGETVASLAEASQRVGFRVQQPDPATLPAGLGPTPSVDVWPATEYRFTFDRRKAQAYFRASGHPEVDLPERFDGASLVVAVPAAAFLEYTAPGNTQMLVLGQAHELEVGVEGDVTLDELREFLLSLPDLPPDTVRQLRAIEDWRTTLPIPVPVDQVAWQHVTIAGGPGLLLADNAGVGSGALWQRDDRVYGVAGTAQAAEIQRVADSLH